MPRPYRNGFLLQDLTLARRENKQGEVVHLRMHTLDLQQKPT